MTDLGAGGIILPAYTDGLRPTAFLTTLFFDYPRPPITANKTYNRWAKADLTRNIRRATKLLAHRIPALGKIHVSLVWVVKDRIRRDGGENVAPTMKPMIDGLVDAGIVVDDSPQYVIRDMPTVLYEKGATPHMELRIEMVA